MKSYKLLYLQIVSKFENDKWIFYLDIDSIDTHFSEWLAKVSSVCDKIFL